MTTNLVNEERETFIDIQNINPQRIDELIEDAEIEAEIEAERRIRAKNTRIVSISIVSVVLLVGLYAGMQDRSPASTGDKVTTIVRAPLNSEIKPIPALEPEIKPVEETISKNPNVAALPEKPTAKAEPAPVQKKAINETPPPAPVKKPAVSKKVIAPTPVPSIAKFEAEKVSTPVKNFEAPRVSSKVASTQTAKVSKPDASIFTKPVAKPVVSAGNDKEYYVQIGAFSVMENAEYKSSELKAKGFVPSIKEKRVGEMSHTVMISGFSEIKYGQIQMDGLKSSGFSPVMEKNINNTYSIILGRFDAYDQARSLQDKLTGKGYFSTIKKGSSEKVIYQVQLGKFPSEEKAKEIQNALERSGFSNSFLRAAGN